MQKEPTGVTERKIAFIFKNLLLIPLLNECKNFKRYLVINGVNYMTFALKFYLLYYI